jgi:purine-binding chemotaxis protein CheW
VTRKRPRRGESINWAQVRARLARMEKATEEGLRHSPERARALMDERARALARVPEEAASVARVLEVVVFDLGDECYAVETVHVREVVRLGGLTPLPGAPDFLAGVTNLRGQILAIFDLRRLFGAPPQRAGEPSRVVVLGAGRAEFGVLADTVHTVATLAEERVREPQAPVAGAARAYLRGVTPDGWILLDGTALLRDPRLAIDQAEEGSAPQPGSPL